MENLLNLCGSTGKGKNGLSDSEQEMCLSLNSIMFSIFSRMQLPLTLWLSVQNVPATTEVQILVLFNW